jgi:HTH-type transcriptional regulator, sugar sensing transcriptional regulator
MEKVIIIGLRQLGLNDKQIRFYLANMELGPASLLEIARKARLQRSTAYLLATELLALDIVSEDHKTYKKLFVAAEPAVILRELEAKHRLLGRNTLAFKDALPDLQAAHQATTTRPRVRTFEGKKGLLAVWKDILAEQQEVLLWTNQQTERHFFEPDLHRLFINERVAKQIPLRVLTVDNTEGRELLATDNENLRRTKIVPNITFSSETYIYGNKIAILDIGKTIFGVITENEQIAQSQRAIFEYTWKNS